MRRWLISHQFKAFPHLLPVQYNTCVAQDQFKLTGLLFDNGFIYQRIILFPNCYEINYYINEECIFVHKFIFLICNNQ